MAARRRRARASRAWNERARADREALLGAGSPAAAVHELRASVPNRPGVIAEIALALGARGREHRRHGALALAGQPPGRRRAVDRRRGAARARASELIAGLGFPVRA